MGLVQILIPSHVNRGAEILNTNKLFSKEKNSILISNNVNKSTSNTSRHLDLGFISGERFFWWSYLWVGLCLGGLKRGTDFLLQPK